MSVVIETTIGDIIVDLFIEERPQACLNFLKLCKLKYYNYNLFHNIERNFIAQTGDPTGAGDGGESVWGIIEGHSKRFFEAENLPKIKHEIPGLLSLVSTGKNMVSSQFFFTLGQDLISLDNIHCVIGEVAEGHDILRKLNESIVDEKFRPYQDIRITHTVILEDPFEDPRGFRMPSKSPSPSSDRLKNGRIAADEEIDDTEGKTAQEIQEMLAEKEAKARATILEIVGDLPDADIAPPENVLFVCKLNPVTTEDDLEIIFSRFGKVVACEVIKDKISGDSLQYAFVEFDDKKACEAAYFKMDNVLIDDRRIHVDFSQSVAKVQWRGKGRGLVYKDGKEDRKLDFNNYKHSKREDRDKRVNRENNASNSFHKRSRSPIERNNRKVTRKSRSYSPNRPSSSTNREYKRGFNDYRQQRFRRPEYRNFARSRSGSPSRYSSRGRYPDNRRERYNNRDEYIRKNYSRNTKRDSRSRSPYKSYSSSGRYENRREKYSRSGQRDREQSFSQERHKVSRRSRSTSNEKSKKKNYENSVKTNKVHSKSNEKTSSRNKKHKNKTSKTKKSRKKEKNSRKQSSSESESTDSSNSMETSDSDSNNKHRNKNKKKNKNTSSSDSSPNH